MSPVSRNLHAKVTLLGLELEDMLFLAMACAVAMLVGQFSFSDRYMFFLPMNWFLMLMVLVTRRAGADVVQVWQAARLFARPGDLLCGMPRSYCAFARDRKLTTEFIIETRRRRGSNARTMRSRNDRSKIRRYANCSRCGTFWTT